MISDSHNRGFPLTFVWLLPDLAWLPALLLVLAIHVRLVDSMQCWSSLPSDHAVLWPGDIS
jgi:hypothetical protein